MDFRSRMGEKFEDYQSRARSKLDEILQELVDKSEESATDEEKLALESESMPPPCTPSKRSGRAPRKRKKKEPTSDSEYMEASRPTYTIKLFDRSVDLAQFDSNAPLYVMARAWMLNKPYTRYFLGIEKTEEQMLEFQRFSEQGDDVDLTYRLPKPVKTEAPVIARPLPPALKKARLEDVVDQGTDITELRRENIHRWRRVKQRWREASLKNQERYLGSLMTLKKLFTQP